MNKEQAIIYLKCSGFSKDQIRAIAEAFINGYITKEEKLLIQSWRNNRGISIEEFEDALDLLKEGGKE